MLEFKGTPGSVAILAILWGLCIALAVLAAEIDPDDEMPMAQLMDGVRQLASYPLGWAYMRWFVNHTQLGERSLRFTGSLWAYLGWTLFTIVSSVTLIGPAWVLMAFCRWLAGHIQNAGGQVRFIGKGHQFLWRTLVWILSCVPIVTMPWATRW